MTNREDDVDHSTVYDLPRPYRVLLATEALRMSNEQRPLARTDVATIAAHWTVPIVDHGPADNGDLDAVTDALNAWAGLNVWGS